MSAKPRDCELIDRARTGEPDALAELYDRYHESVHAVAYRLTGSAADAADVLQDVFVGLPEALRSFRAEGTLKAWLERVTARAALLRKRRQKRRCEVQGSAASQHRRVSRPDRVEERLSLERALARLADERRRVFVLKEIEGYSHKEIASMMGITPGHSATLLYRARQTLMALLEDSE